MQSNLSDEISALKRHLDENADSMVFARLAERYLRLNETEKAIALCQQGLSRHPQYATGHFVLSKCLYANKQYDETEKRLKKVLALEPNFLSAHKLYSDLMKEIGWEKSRELSLLRILEIDPLNVNIKSMVESGKTAEVEEEVSEPLLTKEPEEKLSTDIELEESLDDALGLSALDETDLMTEEDKYDIEFETQSIDREEERFSEILDDIFSPSVEEQVRQENEARDTLKKAASMEAASLEIEEEKQEIADEVETAAATEGERGEEDEEIDVLDVSEEEKPEEEGAETFAEMAGIFTPEKEAPEEEALSEETDEETIELDALRSEPLPPVDFSDLPEEEVESLFEEQDESLTEFGSIKIEDDLEEQEEFSKFLAELDDYNETEITDSETPKIGRPLHVKKDEPAKQMKETPLEHVEEPEDEAEDDSTKEKFVTPTLGEIYAAQGQYGKAIAVFERLLKQNPDEERYKIKLDYLRKKLQEEQN